MLRIPTRAEYDALQKNTDDPIVHTDFMYECVCNFIRNVDAMHEKHPECSYDELARDYMAWLKKHWTKH